MKYPYLGHPTANMQKAESVGRINIETAIKDIPYLLGFDCTFPIKPFIVEIRAKYFITEDRI